ncbi:MAG: hypothetical protein EB060_03190 [Proteobacteria bacterium]|nr:hypothetical protein [Pseudomonadota bacterium]
MSTNRVILTLAACAMMAAATGASAGEPYCREYTQNVKVGSGVHQGYGTACMQPDGSWKLYPNDGEQAEQPSVVNIINSEPAPAPTVTYIVRDHYYAPPRPVNYIVFGNYHHSPVHSYWHDGWYGHHHYY